MPLWEPAVLEHERCQCSNSTSTSDGAWEAFSGPIALIQGTSQPCVSLHEWQAIKGVPCVWAASLASTSDALTRCSACWWLPQPLYIRHLGCCLVHPRREEGGTVMIVSMRLGMKCIPRAVCNAVSKARVVLESYIKAMHCNVRIGLMAGSFATPAPQRSPANLKSISMCSSQHRHSGQWV